MTEKILTRPLPLSGFGRALTSTERARLRETHVGISNSARVVAAGCESLGYVYNPAKGGGWDHTGIRVTVR